MTNLRQFVKRLLPPIALDAIERGWSNKALKKYLRNGKVPWSPGYNVYKRQLITRVLADRTLLERFHQNEPLPPSYGVGVDERYIEYPWLLAHLFDQSEILLDVGSTLNHDFILDHPVLARKTIHILTLAPEDSFCCQKGVSYLFADLRDIPIRDAYYNTVVCLSTLEHIGCDNTFYTHKEAYRENRPEDFLLAIKELRRVLKPGGTLFLTVPFGVYRHFGTFQQFDRKLLSLAIETFGQAKEASESFYLYTAHGWNIARAEECTDCEYVAWINSPQWPKPLPVEPDRAAAARAVACVRLVKA